MGMVALIVFGPRKLPQMAKKAGKMMKEIRSVSNDFRSTWEKEVSDLNPSRMIDDLTSEDSILPENTINKDSIEVADGGDKMTNIMPEVREVSEEDFKKLVEQNKKSEPLVSEKQDWL